METHGAHIALIIITLLTLAVSVTLLVVAFKIQKEAVKIQREVQEKIDQVEGAAKAVIHNLPSQARSILKNVI